MSSGPTAPEAERLLSGTGVDLRHDQRDRAFFRPAENVIHMPDRADFKSPEAYYATALHEVGHATGHDTRMARDFAPFGTEGYAREELRAEITSFMVARELGIGHDPGQHAAYVENWIKILKDDPREIVRAARDAEKMASWIMEPDKRQELNLAGQKAKVARQERRRNQGAALEAAPQTSMNPILSKEGREQLLRDAEAARAARQQEIAEGYERTAQTAVSLWQEGSGVDDDHPYLTQKRIHVVNTKNFEKAVQQGDGENQYWLGLGAFEERVRQDDKGNLIIPIHDINGKSMSLQFIAKDGAEQFLAGGQTAGGMHIVGNVGEGLNNKSPIIITEDWATAVTIKDTGLQVVTTFSADNLTAVATAVRERYPDTAIYIAASDGLGTEKAKEAALAADAAVIVPEFTPEEKAQGLSNFNDLCRTKPYEHMLEAFEEPLAQQHFQKPQTLSPDGRKGLVVKHKQYEINRRNSDIDFDHKIDVALATDPGFEL